MTRLRFILPFYGVVLALLAVPIASVVVPPLGDYPNHLARMHILAAYADSPELRANYVVAWKLAPYLAMDLIIPRLAHVVSIYTAGRVFLFVCLLQFVLGTAAVHAALFRRLSPWPAASALFAYSTVFGHGFVNYAFGAGIWLLAFAGWIVLSRGAVRWRIIGGTLLGLAVFFSHFLAFFGYLMCVAAYESGVWLAMPHRGPAVLFRRAAAAAVPFIIPLVITISVSGNQPGGITRYGTPLEKFAALFSPVLFPGVPVDPVFLVAACLFVALLAIAARRHIALAPSMRAPLAVLGVATLVMPHVVSGVWGMDDRLPVVLLLLLIAGSSWRDIPPRTAIAAAGCMVVLLAADMRLIARTWQPIARQFDEFRAAARAIPPGARLITFRESSTMDPRLAQGPWYLYFHLPALAVIERDVYLPTLFKNPMMPVEAALGLRAIDTPAGGPIELTDLVEGADPVRGPAMLGTPARSGMRDYWGAWPEHYDYAVGLNFGARPVLPDQLERVISGEIFNIYRIRR